MTAPDVVLRVDDLTVAYGRHRALEHVSFSVRRGELAAVIGPNGAGKSTMFRALSGIVKYSGNVELCGVHCHHRRDRLVCAYIPQRSDIDLDFPITVDQLVLSGRRRFLRLGQRPGPAHRGAARDALARVGLADLGARPLAQLSGGQAQRAFLARALAQEADLILLDEALSGVDQPGVDGMLDLFSQLCANGATMLVATHDLALARRRFTRCIAINRQVIADGTPAEALDDRALEATFGSGSYRSAVA